MCRPPCALAASHFPCRQLAWAVSKLRLSIAKHVFILILSALTVPCHTVGCTVAALRQCAVAVIDQRHSAVAAFSLYVVLRLFGQADRVGACPGVHL